MQSDLESLMCASAKSKRLACLDVRGAILHTGAPEIVSAALAKCVTLQELRVSTSCQHTKSQMLRAAYRASPQCLLVVTTPGTDSVSENALAVGPHSPPAGFRSSSVSDSAGDHGHSVLPALVQLPSDSNRDFVVSERRSRCIGSSVAKTSLKSSKRSRRSFKQSGGLFKGSSAGGAAQRGAQVFMKADPRGVGSAKLKDLAKAIKAFKIDGFSSKKVPPYPRTPASVSEHLFLWHSFTSCSCGMQCTAGLALGFLGVTASLLHRLWRHFSWKQRRFTKPRMPPCLCRSSSPCTIESSEGCTGTCVTAGLRLAMAPRKFQRTGLLPRACRESLPSFATGAGTGTSSGIVNMSK